MNAKAAINAKSAYIRLKKLCNLLTTPKFLALGFYFYLIIIKIIYCKCELFVILLQITAFLLEQKVKKCYD